jgi:hypothetical protein
MSTPRERLFLAQNPLFRRILLDRNFCSDTSERYGLPELTLRAPESKNRTGLQESEPACAEFAQWPTRDYLPNTLRRALERRNRVW